MPQVKLNKAALSQEQKSLKHYRQFVPSLEMKRLKLLIEKNKAIAQFEKIEKSISDKMNDIATHFPMIAYIKTNINNFVVLDKVNVKKENIVGVTLPVIDTLQFKIQDDVLFNSPWWFDTFIETIKQIVELKFRGEISRTRIQLLDHSLRTVTQRKNLFEKVLIPKSIKTIRTIQIFLSDNERAAVVRSKIAKNKRLSNDNSTI